MIFRLRQILALVACLSFAPALVAGDANIDTGTAEIARVAAPDWVLEGALPAAPTARRTQAANGILYRLADTQIRWRPDGYEYALRYSYDIIDRTGLEEASRISHDFDPNDTVLSFNYIRVTRGGKTTDQLPTTDITQLRQEGALNSGIIDGTLTALAELKDIRVGDTVDYGISAVVKSPLWPGEYFDSVTMGWSVPIGESRYRLVWPKDKPLYTRSHVGAPEPVVTEDGDNRIYSWTATDPEPLPGEEAVPAWIYSWPAIELSSMKDWRDVQRWAKPIYDLDEDLPDDFAAEVKAIRKKWSKPEDRLTEALRLVQEKIRYVGIEIGSGSHVPRTPAEVIRLGYGDCKDKSVLLAAVLKKLGIKAWPALVDSNEGPGLPDYLASPGAFDHAIVKASIKGRDYWLDPTLSHQGGRGTALASVPYAYGLPVGADMDGLEAIEDPAPTEPKLLVTEHYAFGADGEDQFFKLDVTATYLDVEADMKRREIAGTSAFDLNRGYADYYHGRYAGLVEVSPVKVTDDLDENRLVLQASYRLSRTEAEKADTANQLPMQTWGVTNLFYQPGQPNRRLPMLVPYHINRLHRIELVLPGKRPRGTESMEEDMAGGHFSRTMTPVGDTLTIDMRVTSTGRTVPAGEVEKAARFARKLSEAANMTFNISKVPNSLAGKYQLDPEAYAKLEKDIGTAATALDGGDNIGALQTLNRLEQDYKAEDRLRGLIQVLRGQALKNLNRSGSATEAYEEGVRLFPDNAEARFRLMELYRTAGAPKKEADTLIQLAHDLPEKVSQLRIEWLGDLSRLLYEAKDNETADAMAVALADAGYDNKGGWSPDWIYTRAIEASVRTGKTGNVASYLTHVTDPDGLLKLMIDKRYESIWPELEDYAGKDLSKAIELDIEATRKTYEANKDDLKNLTAYLYALRFAGKPEEILKVAAPVATDWARVEAVADHAFWVVNLYADALNDLGRYDEALKMMDRINALNIGDFPDTVSHRINRLIMILSLGRYEDALKAADSISPDYASDYGDLFVESARTCALYMLGRGDEAAPLLAKMAERKDKNIAAYSDAVMCSGDQQMAEDVYIERLATADMRADMLQLFQKTETAPHIPPFMAEIMVRQRAILKREKVQNLFGNLGRSIKVKTVNTIVGS
ncbi:MAG: DUF3857 domain-containing protein [Alphaproteobacteria bacterium]|nr:MAG: DUF3857 domain-containing protein [Alphaproteobacteria bacterium]